MSATAANMAELEAALTNLTRVIDAADKAIHDCAGMPGIMQTTILALHYASISAANRRYRCAREAIGYVTT